MTQTTVIRNPFLEPHSRLGESPLFDPRNGFFYWVDIIGCKVHWVDYRAEDKWATHKWVSTNHYIGCIALSNKPHVLAAGARLGCGVVDLTAVQGTGDKVEVEYLCKVHSEEDKLRFNDGVVDPRGRFFAGSMFTFTEEPNNAGKLYRFDDNGQKAVVVLEDVPIPNGMAITPDNKHFLFTDSKRQIIFRFDYDIETGELSNKQPFVDISAEGAGKEPDGMHLDTDGNLWVAVWGSRTVRKYDGKTAELLEVIEVPAERTACPAFVGDSMSDLVIVAASMHLKDPDYKWKLEEDRGGEIFLYQPKGVTGQSRNVFTLPN
ncbi:hypothetical protein TRVA0_016S01816 [Trichomonascus vanleenenianus]|uniref:regucalcin n=1 Tax=Trichomonascus vanleenenianus TaxID=2268995 RepID=UPI003ECB4151